MMIYAYADNSFDAWWKKEQSKLQTRNNLSVFTLPADLVSTLENVVQRSMQIQVTIQDGQMWLTVEGPDVTESVEVAIEKWL